MNFLVYLKRDFFWHDIKHALDMHSIYWAAVDWCHFGHSSDAQTFPVIHSELLYVKNFKN